ncbi:amidohydrolase family protein [Maridesulfovibrio hydrothermalis]|uniref:Amidohydrolase 2 n=1 Tax=Maridesulfovibrio hydrothermalis AM13 = DSM 14728 TaxID=1121451 RepID=L0R894_9BACT|nr:amidohydrolase family protein [Maridesulfovibrio hydrothermalis]CCO22978.1 Amidohydrolase 2 [Maridesulfovibrio hydrothermalis AM13 = DSM 14728]
MDRRKFLKLVSTGTVVCSVQGIFTLTGCGGSNVIRKKVQADPEWFMNGTPKYMVSDSHFHYVDFLQDTEGLNALLRNMNGNGVEHIMMSGMPLIKKWNKDDPVPPKYYLDNNSRTYWYSATDYYVAETVETIPEAERYRFHPYICAFNPTDKYGVEHVKRMITQYGDLWEGIGEIFGHRDDLTNLTYGERARANHVALDPVYELAARKDLPVCLHNNCTSRNKLDNPVYVYEVEDALKKHPETRITWAHAGLSRYLDVDQDKYTEMLGKMLSQYSNLWIDLSWIVYEDFITDGRHMYEVKSCWLELINSFPDKFMIGSDAVGNFKNYAFNIRKYYTLLDNLPKDTAKKVARDNYLSTLPERVRKKLAERERV